MINFQKIKLNEEFELFINEKTTTIVSNIKKNTLFRFNIYIKNFLNKENKSNFSSYNNYQPTEKNFYDLLNEVIFDLYNSPMDIFKNKDINTENTVDNQNQILEPQTITSFNNFLLNQIEKYSFLLNGNSNLMRGNCVFRKMHFYFKNSTKEILLFSFQKVANKKEFAFIFLLFPELNELMDSVLKDKYDMIVLKKVYYVLGFIIFKSVLLKSKIIKDLEYLLNIKKHYNFLRSNTLIRYILDVRSLIYILRETLRGLNKKFKFNFQNLLNIFYSFLRINCPVYLERLNMDEYFFINYFPKYLKIAKTKAGKIIEFKTSKRHKYFLLDSNLLNRDGAFFEKLNLKLIKFFKDCESDAINDIRKFCLPKKHAPFYHYALKKADFSFKLFSLLNENI